MKNVFLHVAFYLCELRDLFELILVQKNESTSLHLSNDAILDGLIFGLHKTINTNSQTAASLVLLKLRITF